MIISPSQRKSFFASLGLHGILAILLVMESSHTTPVLTPETKNTPGMSLPMVSTPQSEPVKAVSVDSKEIMEKVEELKQERVKQQQAEVNRQRELQRQAQAAKQQRIKEQQQLMKLKEEANRIAIAKKKQVEEEKKHLKELAEQKVIEAKRLKELKEQNEKLAKQKLLEETKLAELNKKKAQEKAKAEQLKAQQAKALQAKAAQQAKVEKERQLQASAAAAAQQAQNQARIAGEVDKYRALILNAIGRHWIVPENVDTSLYSQFRIRLAPDGVVLDVSLTRGSGDNLLDRSAQTAIYKASPLPVPTDAGTFDLFRDITLTVRPQQIRG